MSLIIDKQYNLHLYLFKLSIQIHNIINKNTSNKLSYDILDTNYITQNKLICLRTKQLNMKIGLIWEYILGTYKNYTKLTIGNDSGLDIISEKNKVIIELKNRTNTDNYSSRQFNFNKLSEYKKSNPKYLCIYGCINENTKEKTLKGNIKKIIHNNQEIYMYTGYKLLKLILQENTDIIIDFVKKRLDDELINII
jgi:hypothetical protein